MGKEKAGSRPSLNLLGHPTDDKTKLKRFMAGELDEIFTFESM